jgi:L-fuconolactonase
MEVLRRDFLPADLRVEMDAMGMDACVAVQVRQTLEETRWLLSLADEYSFIAGVVGWIDLRSPDVDAQIRALVSHPKLVGIRHIVQSEPDGFLSSSTFRRGIECLVEAGLPYDILVYARQLPEAIAFAASYPNGRFVLDHLGKPDIRSGAFDAWYRDLWEMASLPNVVAKLSGLVTEAHWHRWTAAELGQYLDAAFECFGADRLMIGSDWPVCTLSATYRATLEVVVGMLDRRSASEREAVLGRTAQRFWNLTTE